MNASGLEFNTELKTSGLAEVLVFKLNLGLNGPSLPVGVPASKGLISLITWDGIPPEGPVGVELSLSLSSPLAALRTSLILISSFQASSSFHSLTLASKSSNPLLKDASSADGTLGAQGVNLHSASTAEYVQR